MAKKRDEYGITKTGKTVRGFRYHTVKLKSGLKQTTVTDKFGVSQIKSTRNGRTTKTNNYGDKL